MTSFNFFFSRRNKVLITILLYHHLQYMINYIIILCSYMTHFNFRVYKYPLNYKSWLEY